MPEGEDSVQIGDEVRIPQPGDLVFKSPNVWHAFWNAGDAPLRALEFISPVRFERYFMKTAPLLRPAYAARIEHEELAAVMLRYGDGPEIHLRTY